MVGDFCMNCKYYICGKEILRPQAKACGHLLFQRRLYDEQPPLQKELANCLSNWSEDVRQLGGVCNSDHKFMAITTTHQLIPDDQNKPAKHLHYFDHF